ncbi:hypothetical protein CEXT_7941, partial [Caerostris extrusa]
MGKSDGATKAPMLSLVLIVFDSL